MNPEEIVTKEDIERLKQELKEELLEELNNSGDRTTLSDKTWLRTKGVKEYLGLSTSQLNNLRRKRIIKAKKLGGTNYYLKEEMDQTLLNSEE